MIAAVNSGLYVSAIGSAEFLDKLANTLDGWAKQSRTGGWSTNHVEANIQAANDCRRRAAEIRIVILQAEASK